MRGMDLWYGLLILLARNCSLVHISNYPKKQKSVRNVLIRTESLMFGFQLIQWLVQCVSTLVLDVVFFFFCLCDFICYILLGSLYVYLLVITTHTKAHVDGGREFSWWDLYLHWYLVNLTLDNFCYRFKSSFSILLEF